MPRNRDTLKKWRDHLLLGLFVFLAYLPLSSFLFALKNDALTANFPQKYFFSAALHSGLLPLWNPYINFGLPMYADPGFAFWNPLTWIFGWIGYNAYLLSLEILFFIWIGGISMYRLAGTLGHSRLTGLLLGCLYSGCGFFVGNLTHINFLTGAAFLPLVIAGFLRLQATPSSKHLLFTSLAIYFMIAGGHPAIPFACCYFFLFIVAGWLLTDQQPVRKSLPRFLRTNGLLLLATVLLASPILLAWLEIIPHITRATPVFQPNQQITGFSIPSFLSFLMPFAITAQTPYFGAVESMRDAYFSIPGIALFLYALFVKKNRLQLVFLLSGSGMLLLSLGGPLKVLLYSHLPLLKYISNNGEVRVFAILSFLIVLSWPLDRLLSGQLAIARLAPVLNGMMIIGVLAAGLALFLPWNHPSAPKDLHFVDKMKSLLDQVPFGPRLFFSAVLLLVLLSLWRLGSGKFSPERILPAILIADLVLSCWLVLPVTGVQRRSPADVQTLLASAPPGIPRPALIPVGNIHPPVSNFDSVLGPWQYYSKQPAPPAPYPYPTMLSNTTAYLNSPWPGDIHRRPFLFQLRSEKLPSTYSFSPTRTDATVSSPIPDTLVLLQNDYPGWETTIDDIPCLHSTAFNSFIGVSIPPDGKSHRISYRFLPYRILAYLLIALGGTFVFYIWNRKKSPLTRAVRDRKEYKDDPDPSSKSPVRL